MDRTESTGQRVTVNADGLEALCAEAGRACGMLAEARAEVERLRGANAALRAIVEREWARGVLTSESLREARAALAGEEAGE